MTQFSREDDKGTKRITSAGDVVIETDSDQDGSGDFVVNTGGVERARIKANGTVSGILGGYPPVFNAAQYGADPSASAASNAVALASWLSAAGAAAAALGAPVIAYLPAGVYLCNALLTWPANVWIEGLGTIKQADGANLNALLFASAVSNLRMRGVTLDGNKANQTAGNGNVLSLANVSAVKLWEILVKNSRGGGIISTTGLTDADLFSVEVDAAGGNAIDFTGASDFEIHGKTKVSSSVGHNVNLATCTDGKIHGGTFDTATGTTKHNIFVVTGTRVKVAETDCKSPTDDSINFSVNCADCDATGNTVSGVPSTAGCVVFFNGCTNMNALGNVTSGGKVGMLADQNCSDLTYTANRSHGAANYGMHIAASSGTTTRVTLTANATPGNPVGCLIDANTDYVVAVGNNFSGSTTTLTNSSTGTHNTIPAGSNGTA